MDISNDLALPVWIVRTSPTGPTFVSSAPDRSSAEALLTQLAEAQSIAAKRDAILAPFALTVIEPGAKGLAVRSAFGAYDDSSDERRAATRFQGYQVNDEQVREGADTFRRVMEAFA